MRTTANSDECKREILSRCGFWPDDLPTVIRTPHGQILTLITDEGVWSETLSVEDICVGKQVVPWSERLHEDDYLEWVLRAFAIDRLQAFIRVRPLLMALQVARSIDLAAAESQADVRCRIRLWLEKIDAAAADELGLDTREGVYAFVAFGVSTEFIGFDEAMLSFAKDILRAAYIHYEYKIPRDKSPPFTQREVQEIDEALRNNPGVTARARALALILRDTGIRPIQVALLIWEDLSRDHIGPFLRVPSVKGIVRSKLRRHPGNFRKRYLTDISYRSLESYREQSEGLCENALASLGLSRPPLDLSLCHRPIFPHKRTHRRLSELMADPAVLPYALHSSAAELSTETKALTDVLALSSASPGSGPSLAISSTRFRKTKATSLVLQGCTAQEIAEAMDHRSTSTLRHYFMFNRDVENLVRSDRFGTSEIRLAAARWQQRIVTKSLPSIKATDGRPVLNLGICTQVDDCAYWPTVTCYACSRFRPYREADHATALQHILEVKADVERSSTVSFAAALEGAERGARALLLACSSDRDDEQDIFD